MGHCLSSKYFAGEKSKGHCKTLKLLRAITYLAEIETYLEYMRGNITIVHITCQYCYFSFNILENMLMMCCFMKGKSRVGRVLGDRVLKGYFIIVFCVGYSIMRFCLCGYVLQ